MPAIDLPLIWAAIIAFGVFMYVFMDGFDLGVGILFKAARSDADRDVMMNSVAPVWDGNETWLVLGGAGLLGAFPMAYSVLLPALYLPLMAMLVGLIFRGVAFEFRFKAQRSRWAWDIAFNLGSLLATFAQGVVLGRFIQGIPVAHGQYAGGPLDWATPFAALTGIGLVAGYALLGATWLIMKTEGTLQDWARRRARFMLFAVLAFIAAVSLWTPLADPAIADRWFTWPNIAFLSPVPMLTALAAICLWYGIERRAETTPFLFAVLLFLLSYGGLAISLWPHVIPPDITIWQAASPPESQGFLLVGVAIVVPAILAYTSWSYWVFRGKVAHDAGYH